MRSQSNPDGRAGRPRLCLIGDSHLASARRAFDQGLLDLSAYDVEFWGAEGPKYRELVLRKSRLHVRTQDARDRFRQINGNDREQIAPGDFDLLVFFGARLRVCYLFGMLMQRLHGEGLHLSAAALHSVARGYLISSKFYRIAATFARKSGTIAHVVSDPLITENIVDQHAPGRFLDRWPASVQATAADRAAIWQALETAALSDGVRFIRQPDETISQGVFTCEDYAVEGASDSGDFGHKSPAFAARILGYLTSEAAGADADLIEDRASKTPLLRAAG